MMTPTSPSASMLSTQPRTMAGQPDRRGRALALGMATALLAASALVAGPGMARGSAGPQPGAVTLSDLSGSVGSRFGAGRSSRPWGGSDGTATTAVNSDPATDAESTGVVLIDTVLGYQDAAAAGTGIVLTSHGEVLTNYHVVEGATSIAVTIASTGKAYTATVVGRDRTDDVALLQLKGASKLATATIDHTTATLHQKVIAVGNAGGTDTLTAAPGTVTALRQTISTESEGGTAGETLRNLIMTDADVVPGDSGGPLYADNGEVVGITTAASSGGEIDGFAIPIAKALAVVKQIVSGRETSLVEIGAAAYLGVELSADSSRVPASGFPGRESDWNDMASTGAVVVGVVADGPAARAGLQAGDTLTALGGTAVTSSAAVSGLLGKFAPGDQVTVSWTDSAGTRHSTTVKLGTSPVA
jgi:S1-C subfamily serine protease